MDYKNGKVYMLEPICEYDEGDVYYGSTTTTLVKRLSEHRKLSNSTTSKYLIEKYGRDNIKIVLMENYPCSSKDELKAVEAKYQRQNKCVNKNIAGRTKKEYYQDNHDKINEQQKEYRQANRDKISEKKKEYYQDNHDKIIEKKKEYRQDNHDKIRQKNKEYYQANRDKILKRKKEYRKVKKESIAN